MILNCYKEGRFDPNGNLDELDKMTGHNSKVGTHPYKAMLELSEKGFESKLIEIFDNKKFAEKGLVYYENFYRSDPVKPSRDLLEQQRKFVRQLLKINPDIFETRTPMLGDLFRFLEAGYHIICSTDAKELLSERRSPRKDKIGDHLRNHAVLVYQAVGQYLMLQDPFDEGGEKVRISVCKFDRRAWTSFTNKGLRKDQRYLVAFRKG